MRAKHWEKVLDKYHKQQAKEIEKIELDSLYTNSNGTIDWDRLAKHVSEATNGRQQS